MPRLAFTMQPLALGAVSLLLACTGGPTAESATGDESTSTGTTSESSSGEPTTTAGSTTTSEPTTAEPTTGDPTTDATTETPCPPGAPGCACLEGQVCDAPLVCEADICLDPAPATCGDGLVQPGELCDDGNADDTDACLNTCVSAGCGDSIVWTDHEECDEGPQNADDAACTSTCNSATCGDGLVLAGVEECDDANAVNNDACTNACTLPACGDGILQPGEDCDDGNQVDGDSCSKLCKTPGGLIWEAIFDPDDVLEWSEWGEGIACDLDNRAIAVGHQTEPEGWTLALIVAYDADGQELWYRTKNIPEASLHTDHFHAVETDATGAIYAVGQLHIPKGNSVDQDWMVVKYSPDGDELWTDTRHSWTVDAAYSVRIDAAGDILVGGHDSTMSGLRGHVVKYSPDKTVQWTHTIVGGGVTITDGLAITPGGDYLALTRAAMGIPTLRKLTPAGGVTWTVNLQQSISWRGLAVDPTGRIVAVGTQPGNDIIVRQFDPAGAELWTRTHDQEGGNDNGFEIKTAADGSIYVVGKVTTNGGSHAWLRKYDAAGAVVWTSLDPQQPFYEWNDVAICPDGTIVTSGMHQTGDLHLLVHKYAP